MNHHRNRVVVTTAHCTSVTVTCDSHGCMFPTYISLKDHNCDIIIIISPLAKA